MNASDVKIPEPPAIEALRKLSDDGMPYARPKEIQDRIAALALLSPAKLADLVGIRDSTDAAFVPSECILYFLRRCRVDQDEASFGVLFEILRRRILQALPVRLRRVAGSGKQGENSSEVEVRDITLQKFQEMLCLDRIQYDTRLDFYECRFNAALAALRTTSKRTVRRFEAPLEPLEIEGESAELIPEVEAALAKLRSNCDSPGMDFLFRSKLLAAINDLPPDEQRVIELLLREIPIDSKDAAVETIAKILHCDERTVRNRRNRAFAKLREALQEEAL